MKKSYKPKLSINTTELTEGEEYEVFLGEISKYSITPTTLKSRELFTEKDKSQIIDSFQKQESMFLEKLDIAQRLLKENTKLVNSAIKSQIFTEGEGFGLIKTNPVANLFETKINELSNKLKKLDVYRQNIDTIDNSIIYKESYSNNEGNSVLKHGIELSSIKKMVTIYNEQYSKLSLIKSQGSQTGSKKSNKSNKEDQPDILLHPLEVKLIQNAIMSLKSSEHKTALIDIFARTDKEDINIDSKTGIPETHTVVLYKNSENEFVIIDPSNSTFSRHIALSSNNELIDGAVRIIAPEKEIKIYSPASKDKIGPNPDQYRDCIDIAVKLAFGLNKYTDNINPANIVELSVVQEITNQKLHNESFVNEYGVARIRQASEDKIRSQFEKIMNNTDKQLQSIIKYPNTSELLIKIMEINNNKFAIQYHSEDYEKGIVEFFDLYKTDKDLFMEHINKYEVDLQGEIFETTDQI